MRGLTAILMAGLAVPAMALECPQAHAVYEQPGGQVMLRFSEVPRDATANQIADFSIDIEGVDSPFAGGIFIPNGFGQPYGSVGHDCAGDIEEACRFWEGVVYALGSSGIEEFPWDPDLPLEDHMAPQQVLLPGFASNVWYSMERQQAFEGDRMVLDVFALVACARQAT